MTTLFPLPAGSPPRPVPGSRSGTQPPVSVAGFRDLMGAFPTGVAVITTYGADGRPRGLTCSSLASVTAEPPTVSVGLTTRGETLRALREHGGFAVNLLHRYGRHAAEVFARRSENRFAEVAWAPSPEAGLPWLTEAAFVTADCRVTRLTEVGDHTVVLGEVSDVLRKPGTPLLYGAREFAVWPGGELPPPLPAAGELAS
ncbi:flavin reductase family protein [Streptomyces sp. KLOTTS4A1]|uniref:flavin reductase family protein n=1 Tax=Streptomyces sp. KLOTTS4A1 TaxID=3390996 RepID=UPI0039F584F4